MEKILVTGASGFVGRQLCQTLSQKGFLVKGAVRQTAIAPAEAVQYVPVGDIGPDTDWTEALIGVDLVVHLAGRAHIRRDRASNSMAEYERTNTLGTLRLAQMAAAAKIKRFIFLSSVKVNGEETHDQPFVETDRPAPLGAYAVSKWRAEDGLLHLSQQGSLPVVIIRPPLVYGPGVRANFLQLIRWVDSGLPLPLGKIKNRRSLVGLRNLMDFIIICLHNPAAGGEIFLVSDGEDLSTPDLLQRVGGFLGRSTHLIPVPFQFMSIMARIMGKKDHFNKLSHSLQVNMEKARNVLHWNPPFLVNEELEQTINWYKIKYKYN